MPHSPLFPEQVRLHASRFLGEMPSEIQEQTGGLSGARVWRVQCSRGDFALRQWPTGFPTQARLNWLHRLLQKVRDRGCTLLPCPVTDVSGATWIEHESHLWECLTWVHGESLLETKPTRELLAVATMNLALLHQELCQVHQEPFPEFSVIPQQAAGLLERSRLLEQWFGNEEAAIAERTSRQEYPASLLRIFNLQRDALLIFGNQLRTQLAQVVAAPVPIFPVLRDVQPAHVLIQETNIAGFIDVGAMRPDSAAADLARLLQRWRYAEPNWHAVALDAYNSVRPLQANERQVLDAYDSSARLLTGVQWLRWIVLESRHFEHGRLESHLQQVLQRLNEYAGVFGCHELSREFYQP